MVHANEASLRIVVVMILVSIFSATTVMGTASIQQWQYMIQTQRKASDPCLSAKIISPKGAHTEQDAANYSVQSNVKISWKVPSCVMVVQYYQKKKMVGEYKDAKSGEIRNIGSPGSGKTELKIWREGSQTPSDSIWVWVK